HTPFYINEVRQKNNKVNVLGKLGKEEQIITNVDEIISTTGSRPNFKFLREIRFDRDPAIECAPKLVDIINPQKGIVPPHGEERLRQPEEGFYIIGAKSFGRASTFFLTTGYEQARSVVSYLSEDITSSHQTKRECKLNCVSRSAYGSCFAVQFFYCKIKYNDWEVILLAKSKRDQKSAELAKQILENYQPETVEDMQDALKDIFGPMFETMLKGEMNHHLGYESNDKREKETDNRRNGYGKKTVKTSSGTLDIDVPRDRDASFNPELIPKRKTDVSAIENKVISMYARGMSQRDISATIEDIYGFSV